MIRPIPGPDAGGFATVVLAPAIIAVVCLLIHYVATGLPPL